jgi:hypothetical protein
VTLTLTLAYLEVPIVNAPLFATALTLQAALGTVAITWLLKGVQPSLLLLLGPGLILGGALSFALFQLVGRGVVGLVTTTAMGAWAVTHLGRSASETTLSLSRAETLVHLLGLSSLGLASEFEWLLVPALACFFASIVIGLVSWSTPKSKIAASAVLVGGVALAPLYRESWWWVITDDYNFFEVLSRHLTESGPFSRWGALDVSRYHWLSYGWSGLLDYSAGSPEPLVTLTRVMPLVYVLALSASLILTIRHVLGSRRLSTTTPLPVWVLVANSRLDWAATSTAGVYAVLAAVIALLAIVGETRTAPWRRYFLYGLFFVILGLTKLPSALNLLAVVIGFELLSFGRSENQRSSRRLRNALIGVVTGSVIAVASLPLLSSVLGDFSVEAKRLPGLLWFYGPLASLATVTVRSLWLAVWIAVSWVITANSFTSDGRNLSQRLLLMLSPMVATAITMESLVAGPFNVHEYFSGPGYFLATLTILATAPYVSSGGTWALSSQAIKSWITLLLAVALWTLLLNAVTLPSVLSRATFLNALTDWRSLVGISFLVSVLAKPLSLARNRRVSLIAILMVFFAVGIVGQLKNLFEAGVSPTTQPSELISMLGPQQSREIGTWLRDNTPKNATVATNHLFRHRADKSFSDDYSLAVWSRREFMVLGPKFFRVSETAINEISLSMRFADSPSKTDVLLLSDRGVTWFVVDLEATSRREWEPYGEIVFRTDRFWIIQLRDSPT